MQRFWGHLILIVVFVEICSCNQSLKTAGQKCIRIATFNVSLYRNEAGQLYEDLLNYDQQATAVASIIQRVRPDILLLNEFDFDPELKSVRLFLSDYLSVPQPNTSAITYPYLYSSTVNTGVPSGFDLDRDGKMSGAGDAFGYGQFPGQYGMVLLSKYPIKSETVRTFQHFLWKDMPNSMLPRDWYSSSEQETLRLSSKSHWDIPITVANQTLHVLVSHPTPPVFDSPEDRNGKRNHDEIRFWADYIDPVRSGYICDDTGKRGGLFADALFVILGDLNADPLDGDATGGAIQQLLQHPGICDPQPSRPWADISAVMDGINEKHQGKPILDTYQSSPGKQPGNLRLDYVLPSCNMETMDSGVFWPSKENLLSKAVNVTDHRLVYVDIRIGESN